MDSTERATAGHVREIGKIQTVAQTHIRCAGARKVLAVNACVTVRVSETLTGEARIAGRETADALILTEDGMTRESGWTDFTDRAEIADIKQSTRVSACGRVLDTEVVGMEGGDVTLASVIEITLYAEEVSVLPPPPPPEENVYTGESRITLSRLVTRASGRAQMTSEERLPFARLLAADARVCVRDAEAGIDSVLVRGEAYVDGLGLTREGSAQPFSLVLPLEEELAADGARRGDLVSVRVLSSVVTGEENEDGLTLKVEAELAGEVYDELSAACTVDAFSPAFSLTPEYTDVTGAHILSQRYMTEQAEGRVELPDGENADKVLALCGFALSPVDGYAENGKAVVEGAACGTIVYTDAEAGRRGSCHVEIPFRRATDVDAPDGSDVDVTGCVSRVSVLPSRSGELTVRCDLALCVRVTERVNARVVTGYVRGDALPDLGGTISVYVARAGETVWECAKQLCVTPEAVLAQNPDLSFPLNAGDKVFVLRPATGAVGGESVV